MLSHEQGILGWRLLVLHKHRSHWRTLVHIAEARNFKFRGLALWRIWRWRRHSVHQVKPVASCVLCCSCWIVPILYACCAQLHSLCSISEVISLNFSSPLGPSTLVLSLGFDAKALQFQFVGVFTTTLKLPGVSPIDLQVSAGIAIRSSGGIRQAGIPWFQSDLSA